MQPRGEEVRAGLPRRQRLDYKVEQVLNQRLNLAVHLLGAAEVLNTLSGAETLLVHELVNVLYVLY